MRLIDADAVSAEIKKFFYPATNRDAANYNHGVENALIEIKDAETIDAVPVVRCKDCEFFVEAGGKYNAIFNLHEFGSYCGRFFNVYSIGCRDGSVSIDRTKCWCNENDYCSHAKRKEDEYDNT